MADAMTTAPQSRVRDLALGFVAGALAIIVFHQLMIFILTQVGLIQGNIYSMRPIPPWGVPQILNQMFWGGLWGVVFAALADRFPQHWPLVLIGALFGLLGPLMVAWFVVAPIKGLPIAVGWAPSRMLAGALIQASFGIGIALFYHYLRSWIVGIRPPSPY